MRVLDLFSGLGGWSAAFEARGHEVVTVDIEPGFGPDVCADVMGLRAEDLPGPWDVVLASPPCEAFSVARISYNWEGSKTEPLRPKSEKARAATHLVKKTLLLLRQLGPRWWWMENPRGAMRRLSVLEGFERTTVTYCQYGMGYMKPTDLWGAWPREWVPRPPCKNGMPCHEAAPRGSKTGTQGLANAAERGLVPYELSEEVCLACEAAMVVARC